MGEILQEIGVAFFAVYGFYAVLLEVKALFWQWYRMASGKPNEKNKFSDLIDKDGEK